MNAFKAALVLLSIFIVSGCSDSVDKAEDEHVFKTQTEALEKAKKISVMPGTARIRCATLLPSCSLCSSWLNK